MKKVARVPASRPVAAVEPPRLLHVLMRPASGSRPLLFATAVAVVALMVIGHALVLAGGGTKHSGTFILLLPVLMAASVFQVPGAVVVGVAAGLVLGPGMPLDVTANIPQTTENWLTRMAWFVGLGLFVTALTAVPRWRKAVADHGMVVDELSGLPTPGALRVACSREHVAYAIAIDFGMYERLLDAHGHTAATAYLRAVADCLRTLTGPGSFEPWPMALTRVRADVFGALLPDEPASVSRTVEAILDGMPRWVTLDAPTGPAAEAEPLVVPVTPHVGIAEISLRDLDDFDAFRNSIRAARSARETRRPVVRYDGSKTPVARENVQIAAELLQAIERGELYLVFQPKMCLSDGSVSGVEALVRWQSPRRGPVSPTVFVPVAEQSSLISSLTTWVLDRTVETMRHWRGKRRMLRVSVNLSGHDLLDEAVLDRLRRLAQDTGLDPSCFSLELTETAFIGDLGPIATHLSELRAAGYEILVDDFGTGCSSFAYLHQLPVSGVKIDRAFVSALRTDATAAQLVGSMLDWCRRIGKRTVAEGVEDAETAEMLKQMGCDELQGYWLSRPLRSPDLLQWLDRGARPGEELV